MSIKEATIGFLNETIYELRKSISARGYVPSLAIGKRVYYDIFKGERRTGHLTTGVVVRVTKTSFTVAPIACGGTLNLRRKITFALSGDERKKSVDGLVKRVHPVSLVDLGLRPASILQAPQRIIGKLSLPPRETVYNLTMARSEMSLRGESHA